MKINKNYLNLEDSYFFNAISKKVTAFAEQNPNANIIRMGIGDVTRPLVPAVISAINAATAEMSEAATFRGYGAEQGYPFLRQAIASYYAEKNIDIDINEIYIGDGAKSDVGNILDLFDVDNTVIIPDPVYPAYLDANIMAGRKIVYIEGNEENNFLPMPQADMKADIIYMCSPNNPSGAVYTPEQLASWVEYAIDQKAIILFDAAYETFIQDKNLYSSIFQVPNARKCAIEFCSLSKKAGFTGTRCGYTIVPKELQFDGISLDKLWLRRQTTKFNGVAYIIQRGAEAVFSNEGRLQTNADAAYYMENARLIREALSELSIWHTGGKNSPYIWLKCPKNTTSWQFFDYLLENANVVGTPGAGFGAKGEGFFRLSAFNSKENVVLAMERITDTIN